jgi:Zn-dependent protease
MLILRLLEINPLVALAFVLGLVFAITFHEFAHAFAAYRLGDPTAKLAGRLTLNPQAHLDPIGTIALLLVGFGWGKPTPFDPYNLRNVKRDSAIISFAGAASNFILATILSLPYLIAYFTNSLNAQILSIYEVLSIVIWINLILGVFNLIPIHPLDGFKVLAGLLPKDWYRDYMQTERFGIFILLLLLITGTIAKILFPIVSSLFSLLIPNFSAPF